jgi:hypothetical protein
LRLLLVESVRTARPHRARHGFITLLALLALTACSADFETTGPVAICHEAGVQCQLSKGPLGVCERAICADGTDTPCFKCTSQH